MRKSVTTLLCITLCSGTAIAQSASFRLSAESAEQIVQGCKEHARAKGQGHAIAVYDSGGNLVSALRMDGYGPGIMAFAEDKARAVANWGFATAQMEEAVKGTPGFADAPFVVTVAGGVPVYTADGRAFIGSVGVSGQAPADDAACAVTGINAAGLSAQRVRN